MQLARVIGTVVATQKHPALRGIKLLMVQPLDDNLQAAGEPFVAIDAVRAGPGDLVALTLSRESCYALPDPFAPIDAAITGIVDQVNTETTGILDREEIFQP